MDVNLLTSIPPFLGGLAGVAAVIKVFYDRAKDKRTEQNATVQATQQLKITADDLSIKGESSVMQAYATLLAETREQFEDYREYTNNRFTELTQQIAELRTESASKDQKILMLTIDRDTLIQHIISKRGDVIPTLKTVQI